MEIFIPDKLAYILGQSPGNHLVGLLIKWSSPKLVLIGWILHDILTQLPPGQNGRHFPDNIFRCIFMNENVWISMKISLNFVPNGSIDNIPALVQIMAWHRIRITWTNADLIRWHILDALGVDE